jgi:hypothetical protein
MAERRTEPDGRQHVPTGYPAAVAGKRRSRAGRWVERLALGTIMGAVAFVVERRLIKALGRRGDETTAPETSEELTTAPKQVDKQPQR